MKIKALGFLLLTLTTLSHAYSGDLPFKKSGSIDLIENKHTIGIIRSNVQNYNIQVMNAHTKFLDIFKGQQNWYYRSYLSERYSDSIYGSISIGMNNAIPASHYACRISIIYSSPKEMKFTVRDGNRTNCGMDSDGNISYYIF